MTEGKEKISKIIAKNIKFFTLLIISIMSKKDIKCKIPSTTKFLHCGIGVVIGKGVELGEHCVIGQNVTIGENHSMYPIICTGAIIHAHSCIIGKIVVGAHSIVGAGSVVIHDVPPLSIVVGNPAHVVKTISMDDYESYRAGERL